MQKEIWKDVVGYEGLYKVSNLGRVKSLDRTVNVKTPYGIHTTKIFKGRVLKPSKDKDGYNRLGLTLLDHDRKHKRVNRLVCFAFHKNPENKPTVNHIDGIKGNDFEWNVEWATLSENRIHAYFIGLQNGESRQGEKCNFNKLKESQILEIRAKYKPRIITQKMLAKEYGVTQTCIGFIVNNINWKHI